MTKSFASYSSQQIYGDFILMTSLSFVVSEMKMKPVSEKDKWISVETERQREGEAKEDAEMTIEN